MAKPVFQIDLKKPLSRMTAEDLMKLFSQGLVGPVMKHVWFDSMPLGTPPRNPFVIEDVEFSFTGNADIWQDSDGHKFLQLSSPGVVVIKVPESTRVDVHVASRGGAPGQVSFYGSGMIPQVTAVNWGNVVTRVTATGEEIYLVVVSNGAGETYIYQVSYLPTKTT